MARVKVPNTISAFAAARRGPDGQGRPEVRLVRIEKVIAANLEDLFPGKEVAASYVFQVTRNADFVIEEDEASDLLQAIEDEIEGRWFGHSVRLCVTEAMPEGLREWLARNLEVDAGSVYAVPEPLGLADLEELTDLDRPDLLYVPFTPRVPPRSGARVRSPRRCAGGYPALPSLRLLRARGGVRPGRRLRPQRAGHKADALPRRLQLPDSRGALRARDEQTQVAVLVELKARFDEEPNLGQAPRVAGRPRRLRDRGPQDARQDLPRRPPRGLW